MIKIFVLLTYDVSKNNDGEKRLRKVAKVCEKYGIRVQSSVFELNINIGDLSKLKDELEKIIDKDIDSIRIYKIGNNIIDKIEILGNKEKIEISKDNCFLF